MRERILVRTLAVLAMNVGIATPLTSHAQPLPATEIACDGGDSLQTALATVPSNGRIIIRSGTCTGNFLLSRDVRIHVAYNLASSQDESSGGWGAGPFVDRSSKALLIHTTVAVNSARFAAGIASNNIVTMLASLISGNLSASNDGECGGNGRFESKGWNLLMSLGECRFTPRAGDLIG